MLGTLSQYRERIYPCWTKIFISVVTVHSICLLFVSQFIVICYVIIFNWCDFEKLRKIVFVSPMWGTDTSAITTQIARFRGSIWSPSGSCRPKMGPMSAPWTLLSGYIIMVDDSLVINSIEPKVRISLFSSRSDFNNRSGDKRAAWYRGNAKLLSIYILRTQMHKPNHTSVHSYIFIYTLSCFYIHISGWIPKNYRSMNLLGG